MVGVAAWRPDHHHHKTTEMTDGLESLFAIIATPVCDGQSLARENIVCVEKIEFAIGQSGSPFDRIAGDFHHLYLYPN